MAFQNPDYDNRINSYIVGCKFNLSVTYGAGARRINSYIVGCKYANYW